MKKEDLLKKITDGTQQKSLDWAKSVLSESFTNEFNGCIL